MIRKKSEISRNFVAAVSRCSKAMLDSTVTMDKTMVSYHMPVTKKKVKVQQLLEKGKPGPIKARAHASWTKQMNFILFNSKGLINMHIMARGATINANCSVMVLGRVLKNLKIN
jgi:hypothetical protein